MTTKQSNPWSVKGIPPEAREHAKAAARRAGMTVGQWLNSVIAESTQDLNRAKLSMPNQPGTAPMMDQIKSMQDQMAAMANHLSGFQGAGHPNGAAGAPGVSGMVTSEANLQALENDVFEMAGAVQSLVGRISQSEETQRHTLSGVEHQLAALHERLAQMGQPSPSNQHAPQSRSATPFSSAGIANHPVDYHHGAANNVVPMQYGQPQTPEPTEQSPVEDQFAALHRRLDALVAGTPAEPGPTPQPQSNELESRILATVDQKFSALESGLASLADRLTTPSMNGSAAPHPDQVEPSAVHNVRADLAKLQGEMTAVLASQVNPGRHHPSDTREEVEGLKQAIAKIEHGIGSLSQAIDPDAIAQGVLARTAQQRPHDPTLDLLNETVSDMKAGIELIARRQQEMENVYRGRLDREEQEDQRRVGEMEQRFEALASKIDEAMTGKTPEMLKLRKQVTELAKSLHDTAERSKPDLSGFEQRLGDMSDRIDGALHASLDADSKLNERLQVLTERLTSDRPELEDMRARIEDMSRAIQNSVSETRPDVAIIDTRLRAMAERIEGALAPGAAHIPAEVYRVDERLNELQEQLTSAVTNFANERHPQDLMVFDEKLQAIQERMDTVLRESGHHVSDEIHTLNSRVQQIAERIDNVFAAPIAEPDLSPIEKQLQALSERIDKSVTKDRTPLPDAVLLDSRLRDMTDRIENSLERAGPDLSRIDARLESLASQLERQMDATPPGETGAFIAIDQQLKALATKLDNARQEQDPALYSQLEGQIANLSEKFEQQQVQIRSIQNIERALNHFFERQVDPANMAAEAARLAAQDVIQDVAGDGTRPNVQMMHDLEQRIDDLRNEAAKADQRTRETLATVQDALLTVVKRMRAFEATPEAAPQATPAPQPPARQNTGPRPQIRQQMGYGTAPVVDQQEPSIKEPETRGVPGAQPHEEISSETEDQDKKSLISRVLSRTKRGKTDQPIADPAQEPIHDYDTPEDNDLEPVGAMEMPIADDVPLAPGTNQPAASFEDNVPAGARIIGRDGAELGSGTGRTDFIAAARRAAQAAAASAEAKALLEDEQQPEKPTANERLAKIKRPLIVGSALALVLLAAFGVTSMMRGVSDEPLASLTEDEGTIASMSLTPDSPDEIGTTGEFIGRDDNNNGGIIEDPQSAALATDDGEDNPIRVIPTGEPLQPLGDQSALPAAPMQSEDIGSEAGSDSAAEMLAKLPANEFPEKLRIAAASGDALAQFEVASRYVGGIGTSKDVFKAAEWYAKSAGQGLAISQYRLGSLYEKGNGLAKNLDVAKMWYERAADQGNVKAMHNLAVLYAEGVNGEPDFGRASQWFQQAAQLGLADSQFNLGILFARGLGVEQNMAESYKWFALAADAGDPDAKVKRDELAERMGEDALLAARLSVQTWQPLPTVEAANVVSGPAGGWGEVETAEAPATEQVITRDVVVQAQSILNTLGYSLGVADGIAGPKTVNAIRSFERRAGLPETGRVTPELLARLKASQG